MSRTPSELFDLPTIRAMACADRSLSALQAERDTLVCLTGDRVERSRVSLSLNLSHADRVRASLDGARALTDHIRATLRAERSADPDSDDAIFALRHGAREYLDRSSAESRDSAIRASLDELAADRGARITRGQEDGLCSDRGPSGREGLTYTSGGSIWASPSADQICGRPGARDPIPCEDTIEHARSVRSDRASHLAYLASVGGAPRHKRGGSGKGRSKRIKAKHVKQAKRAIRAKLASDRSARVLRALPVSRDSQGSRETPQNTYTVGVLPTT